MDYKYKQLELELSALGKAFGELGALLSSAAKEVTAPGVVPAEKLIEQITSARAGFEQARTSIHGHAALMLVNPLPKAADLQSLAALESLLKSSGQAEEAKFSLEGEREKALGILDRVLAVAHRETPDFKPLQECHAKIAELRAAVDKAPWPQRHPEAESVTGMKHPATALLTFVENVDTLDDERWISLEAVITENYGKPLFVAASRGKLSAGAIASKPAAAKPAPAAVAVEKPAAAPAPAAEKPKPAPVVAAKPAAAPAPVEKKPTAVQHPAPAPVPAQAPMAPPVLAPPVVAPPVVATPAAQAPAAPVATAPVAAPAPVVATPVPSPVQSAPQAATPVATPRPPLNQPQPASAIHSLTALATATEPPVVERKPVAPAADIAERQRKEPRLASPIAQQPAVAKPEPIQQEQESASEGPRAVNGDGSQRPQRWGFWRGNR